MSSRSLLVQLGDDLVTLSDLGELNLVLLTFLCPVRGLRHPLADPLGEFTATTRHELRPNLRRQTFDKSE